MNEKSFAPKTSQMPGSGISVRVLAALGLVAILLARALAPALPGFAVGLESAIRWMDRAAAFTTQLVAAGGVAAALKFLTQGFAIHELKVKFRVTMLPASIAVLSLVIAAFGQPLDHELYFILALSTAASAFIAASLVIKRLDTRACALILILAGGAGLLHVVARQLAIDATELAAATTYFVARALETVAFVIDLAVLGLAALYLRAPNPRTFAGVIAGFIVIALVISIAAIRGALPDALPVTELLARMLSGLLRSPAPFVPLFARYAALLLALFATVCALLRRDHRSSSAIVMALAILSQGALDIPVPSLFLLIGALITPHLADRRAAEERAAKQTHKSVSAEPSEASKRPAAEVQDTQVQD